MTPLFSPNLTKPLDQMSASLNLKLKLYIFSWAVYLSLSDPLSVLHTPSDTQAYSRLTVSFRRTIDIGKVSSL